MNPKKQYAWNAQSIRALRRFMGMSQQALSEALGVRQQTISEWETGVYAPRGGMLTLLTIVAERAGFSPDEALNKPEARSAWLQQPIDKLELKPRATAALRQANLHTVEHILTLWQKSPKSLLDIPNFGSRSLEALEKKLRELGLIY